MKEHIYREDNYSFIGVVCLQQAKYAEERLLEKLIKDVENLMINCVDDDKISNLTKYQKKIQKVRYN